MPVTILFIGDIIGKPGRRAVRELMPGLMNRFQVDLVVANGENASGGIGLPSKGRKNCLPPGFQVLTSGNHIWKKKEIYTYIQRNPDLIRPVNYPVGTPGLVRSSRKQPPGSPVAFSIYWAGPLWKPWIVLFER